MLDTSSEHGLRASKFCTGCGTDLPRSAFYARQCGKLHSRCRACSSAASTDRYRETVRLQRAAEAPWQREHRERVLREQEARRFAREHAKAQRAAEAAARAALAAGRAAPRRRRPVRPVSPERRRELSTRVAHLVALLEGKAGQWIETEPEFDAVARELKGIWQVSGDKTCAACGECVPASKMRPPGPANFSPGKCRPCAKAEYEDWQQAIYGPYLGPPTILMRDGTTITLGELARRHRARTASYLFA